jgi:hypothetical protein
MPLSLTSEGGAMLTVANVGLDCADVQAMVAFWSAALGRPVDEGSSEVFASIGGGDAARSEPAWFFHKVPEPAVSKNRVHVDLVSPEPNAVEDLVALGASVVHHHDLGFHSWTVMEDPEGHVFCVASKVYTG